MKNHEIFRLREALNDVSNLKGVKFAYSVLKNKKILDDEIAIYKKMIETTAEFNTYDEKRVAICEKYAKKDDNNNPIIVDNQYVIEDIDKFEKEFSELKTANADIVADRNKQLAEYNSLMEENSSIVDRLSKVKVEHLPEDMSTTQLESIQEMLD